GMHFINLAKQDRILSRDSDLKQYFGPAMKFVTSCLYQYEPTPINQAMQDVVFKGHNTTEIEKAYAANHPATVRLLNKQEFQKINPNHPFPYGFYDHITKIWTKLYPQPGEKPPPKKGPPPPQCPPGFHWDGTQCVPDVVVTPQPQCPPGT